MSALGEAHILAGYVARLDEVGRRHFPSGPLDLRLRDPRGAVLHNRRFLPADAFADEAMRVLRNADGTAMLLAPDGGGILAEATYRVTLRYSKDAGPGLPRLSQGGDESDETAWIDIPWSTVSND